MVELNFLKGKKDAGVGRSDTGVRNTSRNNHVINCFSLPFDIFIVIFIILLLSLTSKAAAAPENKSNCFESSI